MKLFADERVLCRTEHDEVIVTTHRVRHGNGTDFTSMMLEEVCSITVERSARPWLLYIAIGCFVVGGLLGGSALLSASTSGEIQRYQNAAIIAALVGTLMFGAYFVSRFSEVVVASAGAELRFQIGGRSAELAAEFADALEAAKDQRYALPIGGRPAPTASRRAKADAVADKLEGQKVRTVDAGLSVYVAPDLDAACSQLPAGTEVELGSLSEPDGRQWFDVTVPNAGRGFVLAASVRSHTR